MRLGNWMQALVKSMPWLVLVLALQPVHGQFREVDAEGTSGPAVEIQLHPTHEPFVPPRLEPVPSGEPTPATPPQTPTQGTPTPAAPAATVQPTPGTSPSPAPPAPSAPSAPSAAAPAPAVGDASSSPPSAAQVQGPGPIQPAELFAAFRRPDGGTSADAPMPEATAAPVVFNQLTPGESLVSDARRQWGEPLKLIEEGSNKVLIYRAPGFRQIDLIADDDSQIIQSIQVHLADSFDIDQIAEHLGLAELRPVEITDGRDTTLGRGYPERGVLLSYDGEASEREVSHIALEPIAGELFRLRAEHDDQRRYAQQLADLERAVALNPQDGRAHWLQAEVYALVGRNEDAWNSIQAAQRIEPSNPLYHLTRARLAAGNGDLTEALLFTKNVAQDKSTPSVVRARAEYQWGNLLALGSEPNPQEALTHHLKAIDLAAKSAADRQTDVRRMAKDILVDAHLAVAQDIALGNFQRQREVVSKWLTRATELAEEFISGDAGDATVRMEIYRTTLAVYSVLDGNFDTSIATDEALNEGRRLIAESNDRLFQCRVERELSETLYHAARIEHRCGRLDLALKYANNSIVLLEANLANAQPSRFDRLMNGQLYFLTGSIYALQDGDHHEAVKWFDKALPGFGDEQLGNLVDTSHFGDLYVSMGVSYWESGDRAKGVELTQQGADLMQAGVQTGTLELAALSIPYGNLAAMHQQLGDEERAKHFATMMAKVESESQTTKR